MPSVSPELHRMPTRTGVTQGAQGGLNPFYLSGKSVNHPTNPPFSSQHLSIVRGTQAGRLRWINEAECVNIGVRPWRREANGPAHSGKPSHHVHFPELLGSRLPFCCLCTRGWQFFKNPAVILAKVDDMKAMLRGRLLRWITFLVNDDYYRKKLTIIAVC